MSRSFSTSDASALSKYPRTCITESTRTKRVECRSGSEGETNPRSLLETEIIESRGILTNAHVLLWAPYRAAYSRRILGVSNSGSDVSETKDTFDENSRYMPESTVFRAGHTEPQRLKKNEAIQGRPLRASARNSTLSWSRPTKEVTPRSTGNVSHGDDSRDATSRVCWHACERTSMASNVSVMIGRIVYTFLLSDRRVPLRDAHPDATAR